MSMAKLKASPPLNSKNTLPVLHIFLITDSSYGETYPALLPGDSFSKVGSGSQCCISPALRILLCFSREQESRGFTLSLNIDAYLSSRPKQLRSKESRKK